MLTALSAHFGHCPKSTRTANQLDIHCSNGASQERLVCADVVEANDTAMDGTAFPFPHRAITGQRRLLCNMTSRTNHITLWSMAKPKRMPCRKNTARESSQDTPVAHRSVRTL